MDFECNSATLLWFLVQHQQFTKAWSALQFEGEGLEAPQRLRNGSVSTPYRQQFKQSSTTSAGKWLLAEIPCPRIALAKNITAQLRKNCHPKLPMFVACLEDSFAHLHWEQCLLSAS